MANPHGLKTRITPVRLPFVRAAILNARHGPRKPRVMGDRQRPPPPAGRQSHAPMGTRVAKSSFERSVNRVGSAAPLAFRASS